MRMTLRALIVLTTLTSVVAPVCAQDSEPSGGYQLPRGWIVAPPPGIVREPSLLSKVAMSTDTALGRTTARRMVLPER
jgi:hypothetical protein